MYGSCRGPHVSCSQSQSEAGEHAPTTAGTPSCSDTSLNAEFMMDGMIAIDRRRSGPGPAPCVVWPACCAGPPARRRELGATRNKDMTDQSRSQERRRRHGHGHHDQDRPPSPRAPCLRRSGAGVRREERHVKKQRASHGDGGALLYILRSLTACTFSGR